MAPCAIAGRAIDIAAKNAIKRIADLIACVLLAAVPVPPTAGPKPPLSVEVRVGRG